jgi:hypothetical protein
MKQKHLTMLAITLAVLLLSLTGYTLVYIVTNNKAVESHLKDQIIAEVAKNKPQNGLNGENASEGQILEAIAAYCKRHNDCTGSNGKDGKSPIKGIDYTDGVNGQNGSNGADGKDGVGQKGDPGQPGQPGRETEFRCNPDNDNYEWRYVGDDSWQIIQPNSNACKSAPV